MKAKNSLRGFFCPWLTYYILNIRSWLLKPGKKKNSPDDSSSQGKFILLFYFFLIIFFSLMAVVDTYSQSAQTITGKVTDERGEALAGAIIKLKGTTLATSSGKEGAFRIKAPSANPTLIISFIGYQPQETTLKPGQTSLSVSLSPDSTQLNEVQIVSTGYQQIPKERATGSFVQINNELFNRRVSTNVLERLDGIASGVLFNTNQSSSYEPFNIRGRSTLLTNGTSKGAADPLIVLDNFPYEGDIKNINPNDIESITLLKDAAAASIWGSRSGNGVVVITTKKGRANQPLNISFNSNLTVAEKPDLYYSRNFISASDYIDAETALYGKGYFNSDLTNSSGYPVVSPLIEILGNQQLSDTEKEQQTAVLREQDVRRDYMKYMYQKSINQQYSLALRGGSKNFSYTLSTGYDHNRSYLVRNGNERVTLNSLSTYKPLDKLEITAGILYSRSASDNNNNVFMGTFAAGGKYNTIFPYARLAAEDGSPLPVIKGYRQRYKESMEARGLPDWSYRPLEELNLADNTSRLHDLLLRAGLKYAIGAGFTSELLYQQERQSGSSRNLQLQQSYEVRNYINRFASINTSTGLITYNFPKGDILNLRQSELSSYNLRGQLNYDHLFARQHALNGLMGFELKESKTDGYDRSYYGYDNEYGTSVTNLDFKNSYPTNPSGSGVLPALNSLVPGTVNRYVSYYANMGYTYKSRYTLTASARQDGANIFGVKTNDKVTPLWSAGMGWTISREAFYHSGLLPLLKLRASYGYNGNVYNASALLTARYIGNNVLGLPYSVVNRPPNPGLSWERVKNVNIGLDFESAGNRVSGTVEFFRKEGKDLIEDIPLAPSRGFSSFRGNGASTRTKGLDLTLNTVNLKGKWNWKSVLLFSYASDKVTAFDQSYNNTQLTQASFLIPVTGKSLFGVYSYTWRGLDPATGDPVGVLNGEESRDWEKIITTTPADSLVYSGSSKPKIYGSVMNSLSWRKWSVSVNILFRLGYFFRKETTSLNYADVISMPRAGFGDRWQQPGDELFTTVPSAVYPSNNNRSDFYRFAEVNIEKGDHIRLQDVSLNYMLSRKLSFYMYAANLGILWKATKTDIDPDFPSYDFVWPRTFSFGLKASF
ncbi:SusC/RagA family TonB-linked outer membrane protein [Arcticibacter tournemirensis]|nr:SusC/RagA family TonB-linked outer membrane protein [Arcticibacter tournemirensis]